MCNHRVTISDCCHGQTWRNTVLHKCSHALLKLLALHLFHALYLLHGECFSFLSSTFPGGPPVPRDRHDEWCGHPHDESREGRRRKWSSGEVPLPRFRGKTAALPRGPLA